MGVDIRKQHLNLDDHDERSITNYLRNQESSGRKKVSQEKTRSSNGIFNHRNTPQEAWRVLVLVPQENSYQFSKSCRLARTQMSFNYG